MWFHVTNNYLGENPVLIPKLPGNGNANIIKYEGNIPRICVSNSIFRCLLAIHGTEDLISDKLRFIENPCVYFTEEEPYLPPDCNDFRQNHEMWFLKKTKFYYLARIDMYKLFMDKIIIPTTEKEIKFPSQKKRVCKAKSDFIINVMLKQES